MSVLVKEEEEQRSCALLASAFSFRVRLAASHGLPAASSALLEAKERRLCSGRGMLAFSPCFVPYVCRRERGGAAVNLLPLSIDMVESLLSPS